MNSNFIDSFQHWLQGEINTAVAGHTSRIEYLERQLDDAKYIIERVKLIEAKASHLEKVNAILSERLMNLEKAPGGEARYILERVKLVEATKGTDVQQVPDDALDAKRYRWLRMQHWEANVVAVVPRPALLEIGTQTYSLELLDQFIDKEMLKGNAA